MSVEPEPEQIAELLFEQAKNEQLPTNITETVDFLSDMGKESIWSVIILQFLFNLELSELESEHKYQAVRRILQIVAFSLATKALNNYES